MAFTGKYWKDYNFFECRFVQKLMDKKYFGQIKLGLIQRGLTVPTMLHGLSEVSRGLCSGAPGEEITLALAEDFIV